MESKSEIQQYLKLKVNPIFQKVITELVQSRPRNIINFCKQWFQKKVQIQIATKQDIYHESQSEQQQKQILQQPIIQLKKSHPSWLKQRKGICGQIYGKQNKFQLIEIPNINKKQSVNNRILFRLKSIFLFKDFDDQDTLKLISAMTQQVYQQNTIIIKQGDQGNQIFIVDQGQLFCYRRINGQQVYIKTISQGEMFGEISMLYNTNRTANIKVKSKTICFKLTRKAFNSIVRQKNMKKTKTLMEIMNKIDIFNQLQTQQKHQIQDIIKQMPVHLNQYIIKQGRLNNKLFFIESGKLVAMKNQKNKHQKIIANYKDGDFFGLSNIIGKQLSNISVMAVTTSKLYFIEIQSLQRVIGPIQDLLLRNTQIYQKYKKI